MTYDDFVLHFDNQIKILERNLNEKLVEKEQIRIEVDKMKLKLDHLNKDKKEIEKEMEEFKRNFDN